MTAVLLLTLLLAPAGQDTQQRASDQRPAIVRRAPGAAREVIVLDSPTAPRWRGEPISLSLKEADLIEVLRTFARLADVNLIVHPAVAGRVTLELKEVPWDQALYVILKTHGLDAEIDGRVWGVHAGAVGQRRP